MRIAAYFAVAAVLVTAMTPASAQPVPWPHPLAVPGEYVVALETGTDRLQSAGVDTVASFPSAGISVIRAPSFEAFGQIQALARLGAVPGVARVEPNFFYRPTLAVGGDPLHDRLWALGQINAIEAWEVFHDASTITVAVIDTDVDTDHEDLKANLWVNTGEIPDNGLDDDGNGYVDDIHGWDFGDNDADTRPAAECSVVEAEESIGEHGHGSHVAGIIGAVGGNGVGLIGIAPRVRIMALKVAPSLFDGTCNSGMPNASIIAAIDYAIANGASVMNLSLGGPGLSEFMRLQYQAAAEADVLMVTAAGNDGLDLDPEGPGGAAILEEEDGEEVAFFERYAPSYPAAYNTPSQVTVGALTDMGGELGLRLVEDWWPGQGFLWTERIEGLAYTDDGAIDTSGASYVPLGEDASGIGSNYGAEKVHVAAPGFDILSSVSHGENEALTSSYALMSGTSMASPVVAGAAAVIRAAFPEATAPWIRARLIATSRPLPPLEGRIRSGGVIDLLAALCAPGAPVALEGCTSGGGLPAPGDGRQPLPLGQESPDSLGSSGAEGLADQLR